MHRTYVQSQRHVERREGWFDANDPHKYVSEYHAVSMDRMANPFMNPPSYDNFSNSKQMDYGLLGSTHDPYMAMKTSPAKNHNNVMVHKKQEYDDDEEEEEEEYSSDDDHHVKNGVMMEQKMMNNHEKHGYGRGPRGHVLPAKPEYHDYRFGPNMGMKTVSQAKNHGYNRDHVLHAKPEYHDYRFGPNMAMKTDSQKNHNSAYKNEDDEYSSEEEESSDEELVENMKRMGTMEKTTNAKRTIMW